METPDGPVSDADVIDMFARMRLSIADIAADFNVPASVVRAVVGPKAKLKRREPDDPELEK